MKCLACWKTIDEQDKNCPFCGTNQEEMKNFLALSLMVQKGKIEGGEIKSSVMDFLEKVDPDKTQEIKQKMKKTAVKPPLAPYIPTTLAPYQSPRPTTITKEPETLPGITTATPAEEIKLPTVICPKCKNEVKLMRYCKYCGNQLLVECSKCGAEVKATYKFCPKCGAEITNDKKPTEN